MKSSSRIKSWEITSESNYRNRRQFIRDAGLAIGAGVVASTLPLGARADGRDLNTVPGPYSTDEEPPVVVVCFAGNFPGSDPAVRFHGHVLLNSPSRPVFRT